MSIETPRDAAGLCVLLRNQHRPRGSANSWEGRCGWVPWTGEIWPSKQLTLPNRERWLQETSIPTSLPRPTKIGKVMRVVGYVVFVVQIARSNSKQSTISTTINPATTIHAHWVPVKEWLVSQSSKAARTTHSRQSVLN